MSVAIIDYGSGNLRSAEKAFQRAAREHGVNGGIGVTSDPEVARKADRIVLPGVGAFRDCRNGLKAIGGMEQVIFEHVAAGRPFLGICVGMQLMADRGLEHEETEGFKWIAGDVVRIEPTDPNLKIPHMGWNTLVEHTRHPLLDGITLGPDGLHAYFVHSYHLAAADDADIVATCDYGGPVTAIVAKDNIAGTQFHPEKSQTLGLALIGNFLNWRP